ncbi:DNA-binding PadR family transcriptional regulator [Evansella vedderi]|uniref:DNA-binding PadR family transcriptional regulator n=1 Tax=Evansella vedderi TaxID=38282 RepID=A0ABU0A131_9BACI|nr:helix-turn-helix transcriptional regulator [Evansella vedderi]MDQ0256418.1 DNA-binding PadR family transcriptional regulator [Evansella vedderi]
MTATSSSLNKIGLTQRDVLHLIILQIINQAPTHAAAIYRVVSEKSRKDQTSQTRSRTYVYKTIEELQKTGLIEYQKQGRKKIFYLCNDGSHFLEEYRKTIYPTLEKLIKIMDHMRKTISSQTVHTLDVSLSDHEKRYLSKIVNVKVLIRWYTLHRLIHEKTLHGGALYRDMSLWFGWVNNQGYFYQVLREMDYDELVSSFWLDEETRSQRSYGVTEFGKKQYSILTTKVKEHLNEVHQALRFMIEQFHHTP